MAGRDYKNCDVCGGKSFYDANLRYIHKDSKEAKEQARVDFECNRYRPEGKKLTPTLIFPPGQVHTLYGLGDWKVICPLCAKDYEVVVRKKGEQSRRLSVREKAEKHGFQIGKRTDNREEIDCHKRYEEDLDR